MTSCIHLKVCSFNLLLILTIPYFGVRCDSCNSCSFILIAMLASLNFLHAVWREYWKFIFFLPLSFNYFNCMVFQNLGDLFVVIAGQNCETTNASQESCIEEMQKLIIEQLLKMHSLFKLRTFFSTMTVTGMKEGALVKPTWRKQT